MGDVLVLYTILSSFEVYDIGTRNLPTQDLSLVVAHRVVASQKPAIASIAFAQLQLDFITRAARQSATPIRLEPFQIITMNYRARASLPPLIEADAEVIECDAVNIKTFAGGSEYAN